MHVFHVNQALCVEVVMANGGYRVSHGDSGAGVVGGQLAVSVGGAHAASDTLSYGGGEGEVLVAHTRREHRVLSVEQMLS